MYRIEICGEIIPDGYSWVYDYLKIPCVYPQKIKNELKKANGQPIELWINSGGGSVSAGSEIYNLIGDYKGQKKAIIIHAYSAASLISCACESEIANSAMFMIHRTSTSYVSGNKNDMEDAAKMLDAFDSSIADVYVKKTGKTKEEILELMDKTSWMTPDMAIQHGFCDRKYEFDASAKNFLIVSNSAGIPQEAFEKIKDILLKQKMEGEEKMENGTNSPVNIPGMQPVQAAGIPNVALVGGARPEFTSMQSTATKIAPIAVETPKTAFANAQELANAYPELVDEIIKAERKRIKDIDAISVAISDKKMIENAKYTNPVSAQELSYQAMMADSKAGAVHNAASIADTIDSGVENVTAQPGNVGGSMVEPEAARRKTILANAFKK